MSWDPMNMYRVDGILYGYIGQKQKTPINHIVFFKIVEKNGNKLTLVRLLNKSAQLRCKVPGSIKDDTQFKVTANRNTGAVKIKYEGETFKLSRWDGEPKWSD